MTPARRALIATVLRAHDRRTRWEPDRGRGALVRAAHLEHVAQVAALPSEPPSPSDDVWVPPPTPVFPTYSHPLLETP